jgi:hypothetical protein
MKGKGKEKNVKERSGNQNQIKDMFTLYRLVPRDDLIGKQHDIELNNKRRKQQIKNRS